MKVEQSYFRARKCISLFGFSVITDRRTNGKAESIMPLLASLVWWRHKNKLPTMRAFVLSSRHFIIEQISLKLGKVYKHLQTLTSKNSLIL